jgi:glutamyl-Q tRNA(Asp) synthetase
MDRLPYRGRFAPTPSGPLHLGSLLTALASFLQARAAGGSWLLRVDDLDGPRCRPEHAETILRQLEAHALLWDETPRFQSRHVEEYGAAYGKLEQTGLLYPCACTRAQLARDSLPGVDGPIYAGTCRGLAATPPRPAWRLRTGPGRLELDDPWQGLLKRDAEKDIGDFVLRRADGAIGYQLACVVDEAAQGITEVVRGADLIGSSFRQLWLQQLMRLAPPAYRHLPVLAGADGRKLSKQNHAEAVETRRAPVNLLECLGLLGQPYPAELRQAPAPEILAWAIAHWNSGTVPGGVSMRAPRL